MQTKVRAFERRKKDNHFFFGIPSLLLFVADIFIGTYTDDSRTGCLRMKMVRIKCEIGSYRFFE